jgi:hypothetical protein
MNFFLITCLIVAFVPYFLTIPYCINTIHHTVFVRLARWKCNLYVTQQKPIKLATVVV